jgi:hypothetical protein
MVEGDMGILPPLGQQFDGLDVGGAEVNSYNTAFNPNPCSDQAEHTSSDHNYPTAQDFGNIFQVSSQLADDYSNNILPCSPVDLGTPPPSTALDFGTFDDPYFSVMDGAFFEPTTIAQNIGAEHDISDFLDHGPTP